MRKSARNSAKGITIFLISLLYLLFLKESIATRGLFEYVGNDYRAFRASAEVVKNYGYSELYDLGRQEEFQRPLFDAYTKQSSQRMDYATIPTPYLPIFVAPFQALLSFDPIAGFLLYSTINLLLLIAYLYRFSNEVAPKVKLSSLALILLSAPVVLTIQFGQVNLWLLIFLGETIIALNNKNELTAGLWLSAFLLKPQMLVLIIPGLLIGKKIRILLGLGIGSLVVLGFSLYLAGFDGMTDLGELILLYPGNLPTTFPQSMMNWRALAVNLAQTFPPQISWSVAVLGMLVTVGVVLQMWRAQISTSSSRFQLILLATFAATFSVTWHAHVHMSLSLIVLLIFLRGKKILNASFMEYWILAPTTIFLLLAVFNKLEDAHALLGLSMLVLNSYLVFWAYVLLSGKQSHERLSRYLIAGRLPPPVVKKENA